MPSLKISILTTHLLFSVAAAGSPNPKIDTLDNLLKTPFGSNSAKVDSLTKPASIMLTRDIEQAKLSVRQAAKLSSQLGYSEDKMASLGIRYLSGRENTLPQPRETFVYFQEMLEMAEKVGDEQQRIKAYESLAVICMEEANYPSALEYHLLALHCHEARKNHSGIIKNLIKIGGVYFWQREYDTALETLGRALKLATEHADSAHISICYTNLGNVYNRTRRRSEAFDYYAKALAIRGNEPAQNMANLINLGAIYSNWDEPAKAKACFDKALDLGYATDNKRGLSDAYSRIGFFALQKGRFAEAKFNIDKALELAEERNLITIRRTCHNMLSEFYAKTGNFKNAYLHHQKYKVLADSLLNRQAARRIALLESSYKFSKERKVYELEKATSLLRIKSQKQTIFTLVLISLLVFSLAVTVYWYGRMRKRLLQMKIENMNCELEANQKAMAVAQLKLVQTAERDEQTIRALEEIGQRTDQTGQQSIGALIRDYKLQSNRSNWEEFEALFAKVNSSFWEKLNSLYPDLTPNERKLCAFLKLNMNNKDIALITLQSEEALKKSRLRLRGKLNLEQGANLTAFIQSL